MIRSVLFDTETTGLDPLTGDRVIEVAALELINDLPTGQHFHRLIDPQRDIPSDATRIHGITSADIAGKPLFDRLPTPGIAWLVAGGLAYTAGALVFLLDNRIRYAHAVWHCFVLAGSACHFFAALWHSS